MFNEKMSMSKQTILNLKQKAERLLSDSDVKTEKISDKSHQAAQQPAGADRICEYGECLH